MSELDEMKKDIRLAIFYRYLSTKRSSFIHLELALVDAAYSLGELVDTCYTMDIPLSQSLKSKWGISL